MGRQTENPRLIALLELHGICVWAAAAVSPKVNLTARFG
jgi:hypothetical protein